MRQLLTIFCITLLVFSFSACNGGDNDNTTPPTGPTYPAEKPSNVNATAGSRSATITWSTVAGAVGYYVYISDDGFDFLRYKGELFTTPSVTVLNLVNGKTYYFGVSAVGSTGWETAISYAGGSPTSKPIIPKKPDVIEEPWSGVPPPAPLNLQGLAFDAGVELWWEAEPPQDFDYYLIYRKADNEDVFNPLNIHVTGTSYVDDDLTNDRTYSYYIIMVDTEDLESDASNRVDLTPFDAPPAALENLDILVKAGRLVIEWDTPIEADIVGYSIARVEPDAQPLPGVDLITRFEIAKPASTFEDPDSYADGMVLAYLDIEAGRTVLEDRSVVEGKIYRYLIAAIDQTGHEGSPTEVTHTTPTY